MNEQANVVESYSFAYSERRFELKDGKRVSDEPAEIVADNEIDQHGYGTVKEAVDAFVKRAELEDEAELSVVQGDNGMSLILASKVASPEEERCYAASLVKVKTRIETDVDFVTAEEVSEALDRDETSRPDSK